MSSNQPLNRRAFEGPDVETLNILIELGEIVTHSEPLAPPVDGKDRATLLKDAARAILGVRALRRSARRIAEPHKPYDHRLNVFRAGAA